MQGSDTSSTISLWQCFHNNVMCAEESDGFCSLCPDADGEASDDGFSGVDVD
jgi:hypothetical protein